MMKGTDPAKSRCECHGTWDACPTCGDPIDPHGGFCDKNKCMEAWNRKYRREQLDRKGSWKCDVCGKEFLLGGGSVRSHMRSHAKIGHVVEMQHPYSGLIYVTESETQAERSNGYCKSPWQIRHDRGGRP